MADDFEIWFRGEGVGVPPSKPGGNLHDFGDGLYLTDSIQVAEVYAARRAATPDGKRLWTVSLARASLGRVLDLTLDARWQQFMTNTSERLLMGKSRVAYLRIKQELYGQFFKEFTQRYKINVGSYDAIIGPEYNLGGRQLCILHKSGLPTKLQDRVRALFRPAGMGKVAVGAKGGPLPGARVIPFRGGIRFVARAAGAVAAAILLGYLDYRIRKHFDEEAIESGLKLLEPKIDAILARHTTKALALMSVGRKAYAIVVVKVWWYETMDPEEGWIKSYTMVDLVRVDLSETKLYEGPGDQDMEMSFAQRRVFYNLFFSPELTFPKEQVDRFGVAIADLRWYEVTLQNQLLHQSDVDRLRGEMKEKGAWLVEAFGPLPEGKTSYDVYGWFDDN